MSTSHPRAYGFGPFRLDLERRALYRGETLLALTAKAFDTLVVLVEHAGLPVDKETLLTRVWSGVAVEENSVAKAISDLRRALGEGTRAPQFVATLPGRGYRFIAPVSRVGDTAAPRRVAVLPFSLLAAGAGDDYLSVGLADSIITRLSRFRGLIVRPTRAVLRVGGGDHDALAAGRQLEADSVLDGTIRRAGDRVRVTAQLVDVASGAVAWAETFDETFTEMFALEDTIAERVAAALAPVVVGEPRRPGRQPPSDPEGHRWYLKGRFHLAKRTAEDCRHAIAAFERAIAANADAALAHSGIAEACVFLGVQAIVMGGVAPADVFPRAKAALAQAFAIDDRLADAHTTQAHVSLLFDWDAAAASRAHQRALSLDPHSASAHQAYGLMLTFLGRHDAARVELAHALELDPLSPIVNTNLGRVLFHARQYEDAVAQFAKTLELHPHFVLAHYRLGLTFEATGRHDEAMREFGAAEALSNGAPLPAAARACSLASLGRRDEAAAVLTSLVAAAGRTYVAAPAIAEIHLALNDRDRAFEWLDRAIEERSGMLVTLRVNPRYDIVRDDPRFVRLTERVGLWNVPPP